MDQSKKIIHQVYFWLKRKDNTEDLGKLLEGLRTLSGIESIKEMYIGLPASTEVRSVVDATYSVSELLLFNDLKGQKEYQDHPIHQEFVKNYSHLWEKVVVYDSMSVFVNK